jgi:dipeptidyl-peptidase-4
MSYRPITSRDVASLPQPGFNLAESIRFSPDDTFLTYLRSPNQTLTRQLYAYNIQTEKEFVYAEPGANNGKTEDNLSMEEKLRRERQRQLITGITRYQWAKNKSQSLMLIPIGSDLYIHDGKELRLLVNGSNQPPIIDPKLSPDGSFVAYVQDCELYCVSTTTTSAEPRQLTFDARGHPNKTNGLAEFIAQEEMERSEGFWWSDNSHFIAFTQVDESNVPIFRISHSGSDYPDLIEEHRYPFAGKANVQVTVGIIDLTDDNKTIPNIYWIDLNSFNDYYIARVNFFPDNSLALQIENRQQTKLQLYQYDFLNKKQLKLLIEETSQSWINIHDLFYTLKKTPTHFIWASERTGFMHLELYDLNSGQLLKSLTNGDWIVQRIVDIDEENSIIYFLANRETPLEIHLYSVNYKDDLLKVDRITQEAGCHVVHCFNRTYEYCITQWNSIDQYPVIRLLDVKKKEIIKNLEHLQQGELQTTEQFHFVKPQLLKIQNRNNETIYCALYKPDDEQGRYQKPYPTLVSVYGGPHVQRYVYIFL